MDMHKAWKACKYVHYTFNTHGSSSDRGVWSCSCGKLGLPSLQTRPRDWKNLEQPLPVNRQALPVLLPFADFSGGPAILATNDASGPSLHVQVAILSHKQSWSTVSAGGGVRTSWSSRVRGMEVDQTFDFCKPTTLMQSWYFCSTSREWRKGGAVAERKEKERGNRLFLSLMTRADHFFFSFDFASSCSNGQGSHLANAWDFLNDDFLSWALASAVAPLTQALLFAAINLGNCRIDWQHRMKSLCEEGTWGKSPLQLGLTNLSRHPARLFFIWSKKWRSLFSLLCQNKHYDLG